MLSSDVDEGNEGRVTPMISADSRRVETEERRLWWELRFETLIAGGEAGGLLRGRGGREETGGTEKETDEL